MEHWKKIEESRQNGINREESAKPEGSKPENKSPDSNKTTVIEQKEEGIHKEEIRNINEPQNKPQTSNPLVLISILILVVIAGILAIMVIRHRLKASK